MRSWSRRGVLGAALAFLAGAPFGLRGCAAADPAGALDAALADWFPADAVEAVGRRVLALGEGWNSAEALRNPLLQLLAGQSPESDARGALDDAIRADFRDARMVSVEGWLLSETEARLYALSVLRAASGA